MELTVLGNSNRYLSPLGAGLSYLLEEGETRLVVDCDNGTDLRLRNALGSTPPTAILIPHYHPAKMADVLPVLRMLPAGARVLVPHGARDDVRDILFREAAHAAGVLDLQEVSEGSIVEAGSLRLRFARAHHGCCGVAFRATAPDGAALAWWGDTGYLPGLREIARGADLVVAHTMRLQNDTLSPELADTNLSAGAAARLAREAGAARLALAHMPFYEDAEESVREAREQFQGDVVVLREGETYGVRGAPTPRARAGAG